MDTAFLSDINAIFSLLIQLGILGAATSFLTNKFKGRVSGKLLVAFFAVVVGTLWTVITWYGAETVVYAIVKNIAFALTGASTIYGFLKEQINKSIPPSA